MTLEGFSVSVGTALIPGGAIGAHQVPGSIEPGDTLLSVLHLTDGPPAVAADLTAEFSITAGAAGSITNTTTNTAGGFLLVAWAKAE